MKLQVGFVLVEERREGDAWIASWKAEEFLCAGTAQVGIVSHLLDAVVRHFQTAALRQPPRWFSELRVQFGRRRPAVPAGKHHGLLAGRLVTSGFAKLNSTEPRFNYVKREDPKSGAITLSRALKPHE